MFKYKLCYNITMKNIIPETFQRIKRAKVTPFIIVFVASFIFWGAIQLATTLGDPDAFYHAKMAVLMRHNLTFDTFPWMQFSTLRDNFTDHHFLYHVLLIPFVTALPPLLGVKLATAIFNALMFTGIYYFLRKNHFKLPGLAFALMLTVTPFIFRLSLVKATPWALLLAFLGLHFIINKKFIRLLILTIIFVLSYGGWQLLILLAAVYAIVNILYTCWKSPRGERRLAPPLLALGTVLAGTIIGLVIHPYFPNNLSFYYQQFVQIGLINLGKVIDVGNEWYPFPPTSLILSLSIFIVPLLLSLLLHIINYRKISERSWFFAAMSILLFAMTLKSRRYIEYAVPFSAIYILTIGNDLLSEIRNFKLRLSKKWHKFLYLGSLMLIAILMLTTLVLNYSQMLVNLSALSLTRFEKAANFLQKRTPPGATIFHSNWDEWPELFYFNSNNNYIGGLDPTFSYLYNPGKYFEWKDIRLRTERANIHSIIKDDFQSNYFFVSNHNQSLKKALDNNRNFSSIYSDNEATIYLLR